MPDMFDESAATEDTLIVGLKTVYGGKFEKALQTPADQFISFTKGDAVGNKIAVRLSGSSFILVEHHQHFVGDLAWELIVPQDDGMARPTVGIQLPHCGDEAGTKWVEMYVPNEFQEIAILIAYDGFITVLEEMAAAVVAKVKDDGVSSEQSPHHVRQLSLVWTKKEM